MGAGGAQAPYPRNSIGGKMVEGGGESEKEEEPPWSWGWLRHWMDPFQMPDRDCTETVSFSTSSIMVAMRDKNIKIHVY